MAYKTQSTVSPLRRMMAARGYTMLDVSVLAKVSVPVLRKLDRMDHETLGSVMLGSLLRVAMYLECSAVDLVPLLGATVKRKR